MLTKRLAGVLLAAMWMVVSAEPVSAQSPASAAAGAIRLYNPTGWAGPTRVEVPTGRLATPGLVDWNRMRLVADDGREVPFAIREGKPHYRAALATPITHPRAEDLLVFSCAVPPKQRLRLRLVPKTSSPTSTKADNAAQWVVDSPNLRVAVDRSNAMLVTLESHGENLLAAPLSIAWDKVAPEGGKRSPLGQPECRLVSQSSRSAMSEAHFQLDVSDRLHIAVTYRVHAAGLVEIEVDERPWQGTSPWLDHAATVALRLSGAKEPLPYLVNRAPFYGFKDYEAAVKHAATVHRTAKSVVVELGEETTNGRRWNRRLWVAPAAEPARIEQFVRLADEGLVVEVEPLSLELPNRPVRILVRAGDEVPAQRIADALKAVGVSIAPQTKAAAKDETTATLSLVAPAAVPGIEGDGFEIRPTDGGQGVLLRACTRFGLMQAAAAVAEHLRRGPSQRRSLPLVASNPAVPVRGAGFGGGDFEVDFPYGTETEWQRAFDFLIDSGMNCMTDLGMWSNWKMPVSYREMPELRSTDAEAYDEVSGAKLSEFAEHRDKALRLTQYLHRRGVKVWLWLPTGCVPTTYAKKHPEAMAPKNDRCPCFTHPLYNRYLESFLKELLETYPIDGIVMIRDDNGGLCPCDRCKAYVAKSPTQSAVWEQYLILYRWLKARGFRGEIAVYPYFDGYQPRLDPLLPRDLWIVGHGSGPAVLSHSYDTLAPMGDTWIDNVLAGFRVATTGRMKRLLADRSSYWLGGAMRGSELPWLAIGRFGWEPTATVNSLRWQWAVDRAGRDHAPAMLDLLDDYESLWEIYDLPLLPQEWIKLDEARRSSIAATARQRLQSFRRRIDALANSLAIPASIPLNPATPSAIDQREAWFAQVRLFARYVEYHLLRMERIAQLHALAKAHKARLAKGEGLAPADRGTFLEANQAIYSAADAFDRAMAAVPGNVLARTRAMGLTRPYSEFVNGYDALEWQLEVKQLAGAVTVQPGGLKAGEPFVLRIGLENQGLAAWTPTIAPKLKLEGDAAKLALPAEWSFTGETMVLGDRREIRLTGTLPKMPGEAKVQLLLIAPLRHGPTIGRIEAMLRWR